MPKFKVSAYRYLRATQFAELVVPAEDIHHAKEVFQELVENGDWGVVKVHDCEIEDYEVDPVDDGG